MNKYYSSSSHGLIDKVTNAREVNEQILERGVTECDSEMARISGCLVVEYGYDVGDLAFCEDVRVRYKRPCTGKRTNSGRGFEDAAKTSAHLPRYKAPGRIWSTEAIMQEQ